MWAGNKWIHAAVLDKIVLCSPISLFTMVLAPDKTRSIEEGTGVGFSRRQRVQG